MIITQVKSNKQKRIVQGDIFEDIEFIEYVLEEEGTIEVSKIKFPLIIVLTQDCDLNQDFDFRNGDKKNQDKQLISVLVAPIYNFEQFKIGKHLDKLKLNMHDFNANSKTKLQMLQNNEVPRYHFLKFPEDIKIVDSVIDFKHYFSVNVKYLEKRKKDNFICKVSELFRENISQRFSSFLSRIGLPE